MNGKKAKKLRRLAMSIAEGIAQSTNTNVLKAEPFKVYAELKKIEKSNKTNK